MNNRGIDHRKLMDQLVKDCGIYGFDEKESLAYIHERTGGNGIERSQFYAIKRRIKKNESKISEGRLLYHAQSGFLINHFRRMDEAEHLQSILFRTLRDQVAMPIKEQSPFAIFKIASCIMANSRYLHELNVASPVINQIKEYIHSKISAPFTEKKSSDPQGFYSDDPNVMGTLKQIERVFKIVKHESGSDPNRVFSKERSSPPSYILGK